MDGVIDYQWFIKQMGMTDEAVEKEAIQLLELSESVERVSEV